MDSQLKKSSLRFVNVLTSVLWFNCQTKLSSTGTVLPSEAYQLLWLFQNLEVTEYVGNLISHSSPVIHISTDKSVSTLYKLEKVALLVKDFTTEYMDWQTDDGWHFVP